MTNLQSDAGRRIFGDTDPGSSGDEAIAAENDVSVSPALPDIYSPPPYLLGAALLFWGWHTGLFGIGLVMAVAIEGVRHIPFRWEFSDADMSRISDICALFFVGIALWNLMSKSLPEVVLYIIRWQPIPFFPLLLCQHLSPRNAIDLRVISLLLRRDRRKNPEVAPPIWIDVSYPYFYVCLVSASFVYRQPVFFEVGMLALLAWAFWRVRSPAFSPVVWAMIFVVAAFAGHGSHIGLQRLQRTVESQWLSWFYDMRNPTADPDRNMTAIGALGEMKPSGRIIFRVETGPDAPPAILLRLAAYNRFHNGSWFAVSSEFERVFQTPDGSGWTFGPPAAEDDPRRVGIRSRFADGGGLLPLPCAARRIETLPAVKVERNGLGSVRMTGGPDMARFSAFFGETVADAPPTPDDLTIPPSERPLFETFVREIGLYGLPPDRATARLAEYFEQNFSYTLQLRPGSGRSPMATFLLKTRAGHCEYFATATVLALRTVGIPARYVIGYSAHEYSDLEKMIVVRKRHAHAWALAYVDDVWRVVDNTPSVWTEAEAANDPFWQSLTDLYDWIAFRFSVWRSKEGGDWSDYLAYMIWGLIPLGAMLIRRFYRRRRRLVIRKGAVGPESRKTIRGDDSPFFAVLDFFAKRGAERPKSEPVSRWLSALEAANLLEADERPGIETLMALHYRYRFDPAGLSAPELADFRRSVRGWLAKRDMMR